VSVPDAGRSAAVAKLCSGDSQLESEVNQLLAVDGDAGSFLGSPAVEALAAWIADPDERCFAQGDFVASRFEIRRFISRGGMGEVYEAWDSELQQIVAVKTIRPDLSSDVRAIGQFKQEVSRAREISHPNVCRVYDLFCHRRPTGESVWFLTMQMLEGETLLDRIRRDGPIPSNIALDLARQMIAGLDAAHSEGVVHRDFKSGNVLLVQAGEAQPRAVITDFGLAINISSSSETVTESFGGGTPDYMAPEQRQGGPVGVAADQYALGVVMCEMLTGERPAPWGTNSYLEGPAQLPANHHLDARWVRVIRRCLQIRPEDRFPSVTDILAAMDPASRRQRRRKLIAGAAAICLVLVATYAVVGSMPDVRLESLVQLTPSTDLSASPSLSRDGTMVVYESDREEPGNLDIYAQHLPNGDPVRITSDPAEDGEPDISPDGLLVVYHSDRNGGGIYLASTRGGPELLLVAGGRSPRFSPDGRSIAYWMGDHDNSVASGRMFRMALDTKRSVPVAGNFADARYPVWSSDGRFLLFTGCKLPRPPMPECSEWWVADLSGGSEQSTDAIQLLRRNGLTLIGAPGRWYGDSVFVTVREGASRSLWEVTIPLRERHANGKPRRLSSGDAREFISSSSLSDTGVIAFAQLSAAVHLWQVSQPNEAGIATLNKITQDADADRCPSISPNGRWLVFVRGNQPQQNIWIRDTLNRTDEILHVRESDFESYSKMEKFSPIVDDSAQRVAFEGKNNDLPSVFMVDAQHSVRVICSDCGGPTGWIGDRILIQGGAPSNIMLVDSTSNSVPHTILSKDGVSVTQGAWSPQNHYLLFAASSGEGKKQIFAVLAKQLINEIDTEKWVPVTTESEWSDKPRWSPDGTRIFYLSNSDGHLCLWAQHFNVATGTPDGRPYAVMHFHDPRISPGRIWPRYLSIAVSGNNVYLNLGETTASIWTGNFHRNFIRRYLHKLGL